MNNIIKSLIVILILNSSFLIPIYTQELVITIPEKYNNNIFPLPPFPEEVIHKLDTQNYYTELFDLIDVREISIESINYINYPNILNNKIHNKNLFYQTVIVESNFDSLSIGYEPEYYNNKYSLKGSFLYEVGSTKLGLDVIYNEYRLPVNIVTHFNLLDKKFELNIGQNNYYREWEISPTLSLDGSSIKLKFKDERVFKPYGYINFQSMKSNSGILALGLDSFRIGLSSINMSPLPYIEFDKRFNNIGLLFDTKIDEMLFDYSLNLSYRDKNYIMLGIGTTIDDKLKEINPYVMFKENLIFGERTYRLSLDSINISCSFIKDDLASIISLIIQDLNIYDLEIDINYKEYQIGCIFNYTEDIEQYSLSLNVKYKVGKL